MRICVLEHQPDAPAGLLAEWAAARGDVLEVLRVPTLESWPDPADHDAIVALGSDRSVHASPDPWIAAEIDLLRRAHAAGVPVLGLCFGAQALAAALGGAVAPAARPEIGWHQLSGAAPPVPGVGPWFEWHYDTFSVPPGATELARDAAGGPQAFRLATSVGLQFHPEVTPAIVESWVRDGRAALARHRLPADEIMRRTEASVDDARERSLRLFDAIADACWAARSSAGP